MRRNAPRFRWFGRRGFPPCFYAAVGLLVLGVGAARAQAPEVRSWTSGGFKIEAKFVSVDAGGSVTLEKPDGETLEIELAKLSPADQKYVAQQKAKAASNPFKSKGANPFKAKSATGGAPSAAMSNDGEPSGREVKPDWSGVQTIVGAPSASGWKVPVPAEAPAPSNAKLRTVPVPPKAGFFDGPKGVAINANGTKAVVCYGGANPGMNQKGNTRLSLCDLEYGKLLGSAGQVGLYAPLALGDDGTQVLMKTDTFGPGGHDRLEFWSMGKSGVVKGDQWVPYEGANGSNGGDKDVRWAAFLDAKRFATVSDGGNLVIWQIKPLKPLATFPIQGGCTPALSADRKLIAYTAGNNIGVLDVSALEVVSVQPAPMQNMAWTSFAFSPSGKRLACQVFVNKVFVYDVATGAPYREVSLQGVVGQHPVVFPDDDHLILGEHTLVDLESQVRLWQYNGNERVLVAPNGVCWFEVAANQNQAGALVPAKVPPQGAQEALARAAKDPNFFIFKPGATVSVDVNGVPDTSKREQVIASVTANLAKMGVKVAAGSPVTVQASLEQGKEQEIGYRRFGPGRQVDRFKIRPWMTRLRVVYEGKVAWESGSSSMPFFDRAQLKKDESLQDYVKKFEQPNYAFFGNAELPKLLTRPSGQGTGTLGVSQVSLGGVR